MRVISVTPAGRRRYLAALIPHLLAQRHVIDEHHWWVNTNDEADAEYIADVTAEHPDFITGQLIETFRDQPEEPYLQTLAAEEIHDDETAAPAVLADSLHRLVAAQRQSAAAAAVKRRGPSSPDSGTGQA